MTKLLIRPGASLQQAKNRPGLPLLIPPPLTDGASSATSLRAPITVVASATPHAVGTWVEVVSALSADVGAVAISLAFPTAASGADTSTLLNLGVGPAAAEIIKIGSIGVGWIHAGSSASGVSQNFAFHPGWLFPLFIPKGSRVAIQTQSLVVSKSYSVLIHFFPLSLNGPIPADKVVSIGDNLAASKGVTLTVPGAINTKGAWTQITAATAEPFAGLGVSIQGGADVSELAAEQLVDIGMGASGNETVLIPDLAVHTTAAEQVTIQSPLVYGVPIPPGARLVARYATSLTGSSLDVSLHGIRRPA